MSTFSTGGGFVFSNANTPPLPPRKTLSTELSALFLNPDHADITFLVEGEEFPAHKCVLTLTSEYFKNMLSGETQMQESSTGEIQITDVSAAVFRHVLHFLYFGSVDTEPSLEVLIDLRRAADKYLMKTLQLHVDNSILSQLTEDKALEILRAVQHDDSSSLKQRLVLYISDKLSRGSVQLKESLEQFEVETVEDGKMLKDIFCPQKPAHFNFFSAPIPQSFSAPNPQSNTFGFASPPAFGGSSTGNNLFTFGA